MSGGLRVIYSAKLQSRTWLSRALSSSLAVCWPGAQSPQDSRDLARNFAKYSPIQKIKQGESKMRSQTHGHNSVSVANWRRSYVRRTIDVPWRNEVSPRGRRDDMPPPMAVRRWLAYLFTANRAIVDQKIVADLRPSADGSAVRTSLVAGGS